jgi:hypothetical protein
MPEDSDPIERLVRSSLQESGKAPVRRIAGLALRRVFRPRLVPALKELQAKGMRCVYRSEIRIVPDDRILFVLSDSPFESELQRHEADSIISNLMDSDEPGRVQYETTGLHGAYSVIDMVRV